MSPFASLRSLRLPVSVIAAFQLLTDCAHPPAVDQAERAAALQAALDHYGHLVETMQSDSIAALFTPDGELSAAGQAPITGPAAIGAHLHTFDSYQVLSETLAVDSSTVEGSRGFQRGHFTQRVILPAGDTVVASGVFTVEWTGDAAGRWRIRRMGTAPPS